MKRCPQCNRVEPDHTLAFCRADGTALILDSLSGGEGYTAKLSSGAASSEIATGILPDVTNGSSNRVTGPTTVLQPTQTPGTTRELANRKRRSLVIAVGAFVLITAAVVGSLLLTGEPNGAIESIAVLPFQNNTGNTDTEYLSDGLADSLIYRLSQLPNLKVSPTSSVMRYKGKDAEIAKIGADLKVDAVMTGRLAQIGDSLNISVQLIDVRTDKLLWAEQYDRKLADLLATQREIAVTITEKLQLKLSGTEKGLNKKYTNSNEAYQLYLKGRYHFGKRTRDDMLKSIDYYQQAIRLDPNFALAYARVSEAYNQMPNYPYLSPQEAHPQAKAAALKSLEIDPTLSEAYAALGNTLTSFDWNWTEGERAFKRAIELDPNSAVTRYRYATEYLFSIGRYEEAITEIKRALELEPLDLNMQANLARAYLYAGQEDNALEQARKAHDLETNFIVGRLVLGMAYNKKGMYDDAIRLSENSQQADATNQQMLWVRGYAYARSGRRSEAEKTIATFQEIAKTQYVIRTFLAAIFGALGDKDKAFSELDLALKDREPWLKWIKADPMMDPLRDDPRFQQLLKRLNLAN